MLESLKKELEQRQTQGLMRQRRLLDSPQAEQITADEHQYLSFCSNDYLGLANRPELIAAMQQAAGNSGVGSGASNLITGHHRYHAVSYTHLDVYKRQDLYWSVRLPVLWSVRTGNMA